MNKRMTIKKIMLWLYAMLLCLPLIQVGFRCGYVMFNKNAYESYYGETINQVEQHNVNTVKPNEVYYYKSVNMTQLFTDNSNRINIVNLYSLTTSLPEPLPDLEEIKVIKFLNNGTVNPYISFRGLNDSILKNIPLQAYTVEFKFTQIDSILDNQVLSYLYTETYNNYSYLDNAFDYSLSEFIENNNTGLIDFVGLFSGMFLGNANAENSLYLGFANFMMNYALFVSCAYFVFEVLMWFINYARKWLYAFEEKGGAE